MRFFSMLFVLSEVFINFVECNPKDPNLFTIV